MIKNIKPILAYASFILSAIIAIIAMILPPTGIIDSSILWFTAQMLCFCATCLGISMQIDNFRQKISGSPNPSHPPIKTSEYEPPVENIEGD